ncbi:MAG: hypothetical protein U9N77_03085 [Thermodesulfobacteriota bacterium]|nr:hypothetical protein [Thermodesulfobacteriota bacterium]
MIGVVNGFSDKLDNQKAAGIKQQNSEIADSQAVIAVKDKRLAKYHHHLHPNISVSQAYYSSASQSAYHSGKDQGRNLNIAKGISSNGKNSGRLLE